MWLDLSFTLYTPPGYKEGTRVPTILYARPGTERGRDHRYSEGVAPYKPAEGREDHGRRRPVARRPLLTEPRCAVDPADSFQSGTFTTLLG
jgi:hypothetical protein